MENLKQFRPDPNLRLMDQVRQVLRYHHYAYRTEQTYCDWILRYIRFHGSKIHPRNMGKNEIEAFLSHLAVQQNVAASTQRQALNAIVFLYKKVLNMPVDENLEPVRAKRQPRPPVVMSQTEVIRVLGNMQGLHLLMTKLLYGSGLRLMDVHPFARPGSGFRTEAHLRSCRQRRQRPHHPLSGDPSWGHGRPGRNGQEASSGRSGGGVRGGLSPPRPWS